MEQQEILEGIQPLREPIRLETSKKLELNSLTNG